MPKVSKREKNNDILVEAAPMSLDVEAGVLNEPTQQGKSGVKPKFAPVTAYEENGKKIEFRRVPVPQHRMTPLKNAWLTLYQPVTENLKLDMRMNLKTRKVDLGLIYLNELLRQAGRSLISLKYLKN
jgi:RNA-binding protein PNO1